MIDVFFFMFSKKKNNNMPERWYSRQKWKKLEKTDYETSHYFWYYNIQFTDVKRRMKLSIDF